MTWRGRIERAKIQGGFSEEDRLVAASWATCAVGEIVGGGRVVWFDRVDASKIEELGNLFADAVAEGRVETADTLLRAIEAYLKREG